MEATHIQKNHKESDQEGIRRIIQNVFLRGQKQEDKDENFTMDITDIGNRFIRNVWMRKHQAFNRSFSKTFKYKIR